jgi:hypothetical protein
MADTCSHSQFLCRMLEFKDFFPLVGAALVAVTAASVGVFATWKLNTAMKRTEFFLKFTERFHKILADIDALHFEMEKIRTTSSLKCAESRPTDCTGNFLVSCSTSFMHISAAFLIGLSSSNG